MVTKIKWHDVRESLPKKSEGDYLILNIGGGILICHYYMGLWNAYSTNTENALQEGSVVAWAKVPKVLRSFAKERWKEQYD